MARRYSREFKQQAVQRALETDAPMAEVAREIGVSPQLLYHWKTEYLRTVPEGPMPRETPEQQIRRLRAENERLRQERDFLKKAVGFFSQNPE
jgi:transposase